MQSSEVQSRKSIKGCDQLICHKYLQDKNQERTGTCNVQRHCRCLSLWAQRSATGGKKMRLDKFLKVSRLIKRRTVANEACDAGRVMVNGKAAKASAQVKPGDVIEIQFGTRTVKAEVLQLQDTTKKEEAKELFRYL